MTAQQTVSVSVYPGRPGRLRTLALALALASGVAQAAAPSFPISQIPLFLGGSDVSPNILFVLDDSGSMQWEAMPDDMTYAYYTFVPPSNLYDAPNYTTLVVDFDPSSAYAARMRSTLNTVYYNPAVSYQPWSRPDGTLYPDADVRCAPHNPYRTWKGCLDLTRSRSNTNYWLDRKGNWSWKNLNYWPATYFRYNGGNAWNAGNFTRVEIRPGSSYTGSAARNDCAAAPSCTYAEELQNFANWYSYYRSRILSARAGVGRAFAAQSEQLRVGFATINQGSRTVDGVRSNGALVDGVRRFAGGNRDNFFDRLYGWPMPRAGTPLRTALQNVGRYFERTDSRSPWKANPAAVGSDTPLACRQSYQILTTDGYWNGASPGVGNVDNKNGPFNANPNGAAVRYTPAPPFADDSSDTLADVAMDLWNRDLQPGMDNRVPTNVGDPAFWQHLATYTVGLGVNGTLDPATDYPDLASGAKSWPSASSNQIDDLWHAGVNGHGAYFAAGDAQAFSDALSDTLRSIAARAGASAAPALNSGSISGNSVLFQSRFDSGGWSGQLLAYPIQADGTLGTPNWDAGVALNAQSSGSRRIITRNSSGAAVPLRWASLDATRRGELDGGDGLGAQRVDYLRGQDVNGMRQRAGVLGDVVHSTPIFVGAPSYHYPEFWGVGAPESLISYDAFAKAKAGRIPMVYVGANDGMLHGFDANTGVERFAYVPSMIFPSLRNLTDSKNFVHQYRVDGAPNVVDALIGGRWRSVLIGGLGGGGQGIYALDVTDPPADGESESAQRARVLWEFSDRDDADLGYTYSEPQIIRANNGKWLAVFGNGYGNTNDNDNDGAAGDSASGNAVLYLVDLASGALVRKIDTGYGLAQDASQPNGLSTPAGIDLDGDRITDAIYAGDLQGNLWRFDLSSADPSRWSVANNRPLFVAKDGSGKRQPITARVDIGSHAKGEGRMIYFGTGRYFVTGDNFNQDLQTFYGVWDRDRDDSVFDRDALLEQQIVAETASSGESLRLSSKRSIRWYDGATLPSNVSTQGALGWYLDLVLAGSRSDGERSVTTPVLRGNRVIFTTLVPTSADACSVGGSGWLMEVDRMSGARLDVSPFDINGDGLMDEKDLVPGGAVGSTLPVAVSGKKSKVGIISTPSIIDRADAKAQYKFANGSTGALDLTTESTDRMSGRLSWHRIR